jgi:hypothetical protein
MAKKHLDSHKFLFNLDKRLAFLSKDYSGLQNKISYQFLPPKAVFQNVGISFNFVKLENLLDLIPNFDDPTKMPTELLALLDNIIFSVEGFFSTSTNSSVDKKFLQALRQTSAVNLFNAGPVNFGGLNVYHVLNDFTTCVRFKMDKVTTYLDVCFSVDKDNSISSCYFIVS